MNQTKPHPIHEILVRQGRTQAWIARECGVTRQYVGLMVRRVQRATPAFRAKCAQLLGLPESVLFFDDEAERAA